MVQNRSIEIEVVRSDRCCCPMAMTIAVQNLCAMLLSHRFWRLHAITNHNLNVSHSTRFLLVLSNSQASFTQVQRIHAQSSFHPQSTDSLRDVLVSGWLLSSAAFCSDTHAQPFVEPCLHEFSTKQGMVSSTCSPF